MTGFGELQLMGAVFFLDNENVQKLIVVTDIQLCEYTKGY